MNQRMANDENTTDKDLPWYKDVYNYATSPEFLRKPTKEESIDTAKGSIKQIGSFYNDKRDRENLMFHFPRCSVILNF